MSENEKIFTKMLIGDRGMEHGREHKRNAGNDLFYYVSLYYSLLYIKKCLRQENMNLNLNEAVELSRFKGEAYALCKLYK